MALSVPAAALLGCEADCRSGQEQFSFTIPVGAVVEAIGLVAKLPGTGLLLPDIEVTLHTEFTGTAWVSCDAACCPGGRLYMGADLLLNGTARFDFDGLPPSSSQFTSIIPVVQRLPDNGPGDINSSRCAIYTTWNYTEKNFKVALSFPVIGGLVRVPVSDSHGVGLASCDTYWGCEDYETRPVLVSWPEEVVVPIGGEAHFTVAATMFTTSHPQLVALEDALPYDRPLHYELSSSKWPAVSLTITDDRKENGRIIPGGQGTITVGKDAPIPDGTTEEIVITVVDPTTGKMDQGHMRVRYVRNHPPQAISGGMTIDCHEGCDGPVRYAATDPDLPDNYGYELYFVPLGMRDWDCSRAIDMYWVPFARGMRGQHREGVYSLDFACEYPWCSWPRYPIPVGTHEFPFAVVEYNPLTDQYGFADYGVWTLTVKGNPPELNVSPREVKARPGETVEAVVRATDPEGDQITLTKISGPGAFTPVTGEGEASGTWSWTVPQAYGGSSWRLAGFRAEDAWGGSSLAYLLVRISTPPRLYCTGSKSVMPVVPDRCGGGGTLIEETRWEGGYYEYSAGQSG
ncbi:MAG: hypothetical protein Kow0097_13810 [Candidatus Bipolaricaulota bacterium]